MLDSKSEVCTLLRMIVNIMHNMLQLVVGFLCRLAECSKLKMRPTFSISLCPYHLSCYSTPHGLCSYCYSTYRHVRNCNTPTFSTNHTWDYLNPHCMLVAPSFFLLEFSRKYKYTKASNLNFILYLHPQLTFQFLENLPQTAYHLQSY
jgi:hypothetical protein